jgi:cell division protein FtsB
MEAEIQQLQNENVALAQQIKEMKQQLGLDVVERYIYYHRAFVRVS